METTYSQARANLARLCEEVTANRETVRIRRRGREDVSLIATAELAGLTETAHLLRSPANAERLISALDRALRGEGAPQAVESVRREAGLG
jgi:antitoxin YefM